MTTTGTTPGTGCVAPQPFTEFYASHRTRLCRALSRLTRDLWTADEITQEAFLALWARWDRLGHVGDLEGYLYRTALNLYRKGCLDKPAIETDQRMADGVASAELRLVIDAAVASLPAQQRRAVVLVHELGYRPIEAAALLGIEASTVRVHLTRARRLLRERLAS